VYVRACVCACVCACVRVLNTVYHWLSYLSVRLTCVVLRRALVFKRSPSLPTRRYLHKDARVVHRDLKPGNIMLDWGDHVTVTDFGLAKQKESESSMMQSSVGTMQCVVLPLFAGLRTSVFVCAVLVAVRD
jgi:serine/threonine protein kinase